MSSKISVTKVNKLKDDQFEVLFGNVIELCADAAKYAKSARPFANVEEICNAFHRYLDDLSFEGLYFEGSKVDTDICILQIDKLTILKLHPDLAGRLSAQGELTKESANEQRSAGLNDITAEQKIAIDENNKRYKAKFGFPFIICARENKVQSIISGLQNRYKNSREEEINTGIDEVKKICKLRILDIVEDDV